jgi:polyhydroxyalkanoate synthesis regulator protein
VLNVSVEMEMTMSAQPLKPILVKRYARSRLYEPANQRYVTVSQLQEWAAKGLPFVVLDTETGADVTQVLLA